MIENGILSSFKSSVTEVNLSPELARSRTNPLVALIEGREVNLLPQERPVLERLLSQLSQESNIEPSGFEVVLTQAETEILGLVALGKTNKEIAYVRSSTHQNVKNQLTGLYKKLNVHNRTGAVLNAINTGLISLQTPDEVDARFKTKIEVAQIQNSLRIKTEKWTMFYSVTQPENSLSLTTLQIKYLECIALGMSDAEIADKFSVSPKTVKNTIYGKVFPKLEVHTRVDAVMKAARLGLVKIEEEY